MCLCKKYGDHDQFCWSSSKCVPSQKDLADNGRYGKTSADGKMVSNSVLGTVPVSEAEEAEALGVIVEVNNNGVRTWAVASQEWHREGQPPKIGPSAAALAWFAERAETKAPADLGGQQELSVFD